MTTEAEAIDAVRDAVEGLETIAHAKQRGMKVDDSDLQKAILAAEGACLAALRIIVARNPEASIRLLKKISRELESGVPSA